MNLQILKGGKIPKSYVIHEFQFPAYFVVYPNTHGTMSTKMENFGSFKECGQSIKINFLPPPSNFIYF